ncbi:CobW family GTP-binding protein [Tumebacillus permanentifrigoris]|uniref:G3E family GTPase n=1 Tax=Tumebacillus permanentifrigoris TaxID=378543 RepID=A0A316D5E3_9BACL|nr:GTP-binding protein [Tumebacillus permanentifrigoris]PWK08963.1 G3E family GTPase [Tumebacillus permanentifrigoris]
METHDKRLPVTLLTGALGSGKTTLLNRILQENHGIKFGVIVNEFGELSIDHHLVVGTDEQVVELANGCVCCTVREDLLDAITRLLERKSGIEYLVVETTGLADPRPVAQTFLHEELCDDVRLDAILTVLDAANFHDNLLRTGTTIDQILAGDILLLNKIDLVSERMRDEIKEEIGDLNPYARLLETVNGDVDVRLLLDLDLHRGATTSATATTDTGAALNPDEIAELADLDSAGDFVSLARLSASAKTAGSHLDREEISSVSFTTTYPFDYERLGEFLEALPRNIFRGKGLLWIEGYEQQLLFHLVGDRSTAVLHTPWPEGPRETKLVLIGQRLNREELLAQLDACLLKN